MKWMWIFIGLSGCAAVVLGAISAHAVGGLSAADQSLLDTASRYHLAHVAASGIALLLVDRAGRLAMASAILFLIAVFCFCGSIYLRVLTGTEIPAAPVGGIGFMIAWILLGVSGWHASTQLGQKSN
jgi:uncharacterized membrane protein YgdD (TMEM256/DUF423 family)